MKSTALLAVEDDGKNWQRFHVADKFSLSLPANATYAEKMGSDSLVGQFTSAEFSLSFDYGLYSDRLGRDPGEQRYTRRQVRINQHKASLVTSYVPTRSAEQPYFIGIYFPDIRRSSIGATGLTLTAYLKTHAEYALVKRIFNTIQFGDR